MIPTPASMLCRPPPLRRPRHHQPGALQPIVSRPLVHLRAPRHHARSLSMRAIDHLGVVENEPATNVGGDVRWRLPRRGLGPARSPRGALGEEARLAGDRVAVAHHRPDLRRSLSRWVRGPASAASRPWQKPRALPLALVGPLGPAETCGTAQYSGVSSKPRGPTIAAREHTGLSPRAARLGAGAWGLTDAP